MVMMIDDGADDNGDDDDDNDDNVDDDNDDDANDDDEDNANTIAKRTHVYIYMGLFHRLGADEVADTR